MLSFARAYEYTHVRTIFDTVALLLTLSSVLEYSPLPPSATRAIRPAIVPFQITAFHIGKVDLDRFPDTPRELIEQSYRPRAPRRIAMLAFRDQQRALSPPINSLILFLRYSMHDEHIRYFYETVAPAANHQIISISAMHRSVVSAIHRIVVCRAFIHFCFIVQRIPR